MVETHKRKRKIQ